MDIQDFRQLLDTHGADPARWPQAMRAAALTLRDRNPQAQAAWREASRLEALLRTRPAETAEDRLRAARVVAASMARIRAEAAAREASLAARLWQEWRWLFARPVGVGLAGVMLAGWFAGQGLLPLPPRGDPVLELLLTEPLALFEEDVS
ncbi:hypothetical protein [Falsiroseomonas tokyonensis]|uniref:Uncharacterized protein n=1 Tax=Falsiroseomonas tokyonensis TaxID=430521 RepID=A0ABV7BTQ4_9PROT|nr:hypothetical protein [Falsiroseomonas tokyonensis]MBU8538239.1 hypothetical protein [Falsiroseomonas tokyonensis]